MKRYQLLLLILLFAFSLWLRIAYQQNTQTINPVRGDAAKYVIVANNLLSKGLYSEKAQAEQPSYFISPGYPFFLLTIMKLTNDGDIAYSAVLDIQAAMGAAVSVLTVLIALYFLPFSLAYLAGILTAFSPHLISIGSLLLTETLFSFLLLLAFWTMFRGISSPKIYWMVSAGLLFGFAALVRPATVAFPLFAFPLILKSRSSNWHRPVVLILATLIIFGSWQGWTKLSAENSSNSASSLSSSLALGIYPDLTYKNPLLKGAPYRDDPESKHFPVGIHQTLLTLWDRFKAEPSLYTKWYLVGKPVMFWSKNLVVGNGDIYVYPVVITLYDVSRLAKMTKDIMQALHPFVLVVVLLGALIFIYLSRLKIIPPEKMHGILATYALLIYVTLVHTVLAPLPRYSIPFRPILYIAFMTTLWLLAIAGKKWRQNLTRLSSTLYVEPF